MVYKNILHKEWKAHRKVSFLTILGGILAVVFFGWAIGMRITYFFLWPLYSLSLVSIFATEIKTDFLDSRPISRTDVWLTKIISAFILWSLTIFLTLAGHFIVLKSRTPSFSVFSIILDPGLLLILLITLALFSLGLVFVLGVLSKDAIVSPTIIIIGAAMYGFLLIRPGLIVHIQPSNFRYETFALFVLTVAGIILLCFASYLIFIYRDVFSAGIRRQKLHFYLGVGLVIIGIVVTLCYLASIPIRPKDVKFINTVAASQGGRAIVFSAGRNALESQVFIVDNTGGDFGILGNRFSSDISPTGEKTVVWKANAWLYGPEIFVKEIPDSWQTSTPGGYISDFGMIRLSERDYRQKIHLGKPYLSPDKDRIAYLMQVSDWKGKNKKYYVTIASLDGFIVPYQITDQKDFNIYPIGWTPDGNYFYFRKNGYGGEQEKEESFTAIDKNAQSIDVISKDFSAYRMISNDLPEDGTMVSLSSKQNSEYSLWITDVVTKKKIQIDLSNVDFPVRGWTSDGQHFAYVKPTEKDNECYLHVLEIRDGQPKKILTKSLPLITELKWSPSGEKLLLRISGHEKKEELVCFDVNNQDKITTLLNKLPDHFQYDWLGNEKIVYTDCGKLITLDLSNLTQLQIFPAPAVTWTFPRSLSQS